MPDNPTPPPPATPAPKRSASDAGHVPITEEFDRAKWTLPPLGIVGIALLAVAIVVAILLFINRPKPVAFGGIGNVSAVQMQDNSVLVSMELNLTNVTQKPWVVEKITAHLKTDQGEYTDEPATATDSERYFQAFPALQQMNTEVWKWDQRIEPGQRVNGAVIFSFPVTKDQFDARKALSVTLKPYDHLPITFAK